ncbi:MAG: atoD 3 [Firmicutes bacterium]|nr:atoD 3 [Bacillota bacterium]
MAKVISADQAMDHINDAAVVMIGGFLACGTPETLIDGMVQKGVKNLTVIANDSGFPDKGIGKLVVAQQVKKLVATHIGTNPETGKQMNAKTMEVVLVPQGTLAEQIRAGGAGLGGVLTPTGIGTVVAEGKQTVVVDGKEFLLEKAVKADVALIKAYKADEKGNLVFRKSARNFNPMMATAAETVIAEVETIVPVGQIDPDEVMLPGIFVDYLVKG